jgi:ABC-type long-subunit fatty acid transport system fused permease/ATPase subunit
VIVPLAVSGLIVISVVIVAALGLLYVLIRGEADYREDGDYGENEQPDGATGQAERPEEGAPPEGPT